MMNYLVRIMAMADKSMAWLEKAALAIGVIGMTLVSVSNVFMRNVLGESLTFADELNQALIILVTFLGVGYAARQGRHIRMTALFDQLPRLPRKIMMIVIAACTAALLFLLSWYSLDYALHTRSVGSVTPSLQIPLWIIYAVAPIGLAVGGVQYVMTLIRNLASHDVYISFTHTDEYDTSHSPTQEI
ncbi:MAG: TRAP transporter small permease [Gammaproteobacteria bacterium]|nr:TRAP transporter small permease [Gammaproteobacteria bacterium]